MSFAAEFRSMMPHRVTVEAVGSIDDAHKVTYDAPTDWQARVVEKQQQVIDRQGREVVGTHIVWIAPDATTGLVPVINAEARVTLPDGSQHPVLTVEVYHDDMGAPAKLPTNLVANPRFITDLTGWITTGIGTNTNARDTGRSMIGNASLLATYQDTALLAEYDYGAVVGDLTAAEYRYEAWCWIPDSWDGGNLQLGVSGLASVTLGTQADTDDDLRARWQRASLLFTPDSGDVAGATLRVSAASAPTAGQTVYIDNVELLLAADRTDPSVAIHHMKITLGDVTGRVRG
ncbi:hypothetical protein LCGC14_0592270 [marine sediment metagenome]|uniref:Uncharacterized protein n=1 Tax=marine sediment metagenome TaxID=412755 RepID=A0A0F9RI26_9ZZZZ